MKKPKPIELDRPLVVQVNSISAQKMEAVLVLCRAVEALTRTLNSVHTQFAINHCNITAKGSGPCLSVTTDEP